MSLKVHSRTDWHARQPRPRTRQADAQIREIFLHYPGDRVHDLSHIDTNMEQRAYMRAIQDFHMDVRKWSDFAYSFAVFQDGEVYRGRGRTFVPAAQLGHNTGTVAILCVVAVGEKPTSAMVDNLRKLKNWLDFRVNRDLPVRAHGDVVQTSCPGPQVRAIIPSLNRS